MTKKQSNPPPPLRHRSNGKVGNGIVRHGINPDQGVNTVRPKPPPAPPPKEKY